MNQPLVIEEVPVPVPEGRQLLVRVKAASLCHSDLMLIDGGLPDAFPLIIGHEAVSIVEKLGPEAETYGIRPGDLIGAPLWENSCLECYDCRSHGSQFCAKLTCKGVNTPGYFSEYTLVDAASAVVIDVSGARTNVNATHLSPLFCAGSTVWDALERAKPTASDSFAVIGAGGLGTIAVQYLKTMGIKVIALDIRDEQLQALQDLQIVNGILNINKLSNEELVAKVLALNDGQPVDHVLVTSGVVPAYLSAFPILKPEGQVIAVGLPSEPIPMHATFITHRCTKWVVRPVAVPQRC